MTLHEIYATLLRRGMPKCRWLLRYTDGWRLRSERVSDGEWAISESDAADLITMHALRWWLCGADPKHDRRVSAWRGYAPDLVTVCVCETRGCTSAWTEDWEWISTGQSDKLLNAIIASTEHLEPK